MPLAVGVGLSLMADSIKSIGTDMSDSVKSIGTHSMQQFEERYTVEVMQDAEVEPSKLWGHFGEQVVRRNFKGVTLVKRKVAASPINLSQE